MEKAKCRAAMEEAQRRRNAEVRARCKADEKVRALDAISNHDFRYRKYHIDEIEMATERFSDKLKINEGGYGPVYRASHRAYATRRRRQARRRPGPARPAAVGAPSRSAVSQRGGSVHDIDFFGGGRGSPATARQDLAATARSWWCRRRASPGRGRGMRAIQSREEEKKQVGPTCRWK